MSSTRLAEAPVLARIWTPKVALAAILSLVFLCGTAAGALLMNQHAHEYLHQRAFDTPEGKAMYFDRIQKELSLTPAQSEQMQSILNDFWQYYRTVLSDSKARIMQVLNPQQQQKFEHLLQEYPR
jgi:Spy/CpxP family protein refolding chaperone